MECLEVQERAKIRRARLLAIKGISTKVRA